MYRILSFLCRNYMEKHRNRCIKKVLLTENMQYSDRERIHAYWLSRVDGIGAVTAAKLYESCGSFEGIL